MNGDRPYQLRDAAEMIRKSDDSQKVVKGLEILPMLIEAAPDELANYSGEQLQACIVTALQVQCVPCLRNIMRPTKSPYYILYPKQA